MPWPCEITAKRGDHDGNKACQCKETHDTEAHHTMTLLARESQVQRGSRNLGDPDGDDIEEAVGV